MSSQTSQKENITLFDYLSVLKKRKRFITSFIIGVTFLSVIVSFLLPKTYEARTTIMLLSEGNSGISSLASQFSGLASLAGFSGLPSQQKILQFLALLQSRKLAEKVVQRFNLIPVLFKNQENISLEAAAELLKENHMSFHEDEKSNTIAIHAECKSPQLAADIANGYAESFQEWLNEHSFTVAKKNRKFIEQQLAVNKEELLESGKQMSEFYQDGRVSNIQSEIDISMPNLNNQLLEDKLSKLRQKKKEIGEELEKSVVKKIPQQVYLRYLALRKNLLEQTHVLLVQQYEIAKIDETRDDLSFQVIDAAVSPTKKLNPKRKLIVVTSFSLSCFLAFCWVFFAEYLKEFRQT